MDEMHRQNQRRDEKPIEIQEKTALEAVESSTDPEDQVESMDNNETNDSNSSEHVRRTFEKFLETFRQNFR